LFVTIHHDRGSRSSTSATTCAPTCVNNLKVSNYSCRINAEKEVDQAVSIKTLALYIGELCAVIDDALEGVVHHGEELAVQCRIAPGIQPLVELAVRPDDPQAFPTQTVRLLADRLNALPAPAVTRHQIRFELRFTFPP